MSLLSEPGCKSCEEAASGVCTKHNEHGRAATPPLAQQQEGLEAEQLAKLFHETYERLAPQFGYETRKDSARPWADVPEKNKRLMIAVCTELLAIRSLRP